ncbi:unnamed protein product, partial [Phytomonas sp. Hart1]
MVPRAGRGDKARGAARFVVFGPVLAAGEGGFTSSPARPALSAEKAVGEGQDPMDVVDLCVRHVQHRRNIAEPIDAVKQQLKRFAADLQGL